MWATTPQRLYLEVALVFQSRRCFTGEMVPVMGFRSPARAVRCRSISGLGRCFRASYAANYFVVSSGLHVLLISLMKKPALEALKSTQESQESLRKTDYVGKRNRRAPHTETQNAAFSYRRRSNRLHSEPQYKQLREASLNLTLRGMINTVITQADERPRLCLIGRGERNMKNKLKKTLKL